MSAEWRAHDVAYGLSKNPADISCDAIDDRFLVKSATIIFMILGEL